MSYTPTTWSNGDTITAAKLNKLEQGVAEGGGGGVLTVNIVYDGVNEKSVFDKTYAEIKDAFESGKYVFCTDTDSGWRYFYPISSIGYDSDPHSPPYVIVVGYSDSISYYCWDEDEYPTDPAPEAPT